MTNQGLLTLCAVGEVAPVGRSPEDMFAFSAPILREADIAFCQFEHILSERIEHAYYDAAVSNPAEVGQALAKVGFDVASAAGNHHMDAGVEAFVDTLTVLKQNGILPVGVGMNLGEARTPAVVERKGIRVAFLGYSSIIPRAEVCYEARINAPGCAPMFISTFYDQIDYNPGTLPKVVTIAQKDNLAAMEEDIRRAKAQADVVVMSIHWGIHHLPFVIPMYEWEVGHAAIDAGADLILGHHAQILKGIEVYKGRVIFHSVARFAAGSEPQPAGKGYWESQRPPHTSQKLDKFLQWAWKEWLPQDEKKTIIAKCLISRGGIERVSFLPCMINQARQPEPLAHNDKRSDEVYHYVERACREVELDTRFSREGDEVVVLT